MWKAAHRLSLSFFVFWAKPVNYRSLIRRLLGAASLIRLWVINRVSTRWKRSATIECLPFIYSSFRHSFYKDRLTVWAYFRYQFHVARCLWCRIGIKFHTKRSSNPVRTVLNDTQPEIKIHTNCYYQVIIAPQLSIKLSYWLSWSATAL